MKAFDGKGWVVVEQEQGKGGWKGRSEREEGKNVRKESGRDCFGGKSRGRRRVKYKDGRKGVRNGEKQK